MGEILKLLKVSYIKENEKKPSHENALNIQ